MKSADDIIPSHASPRNSNSAKTMKTWRKNYSSPEINIKPLPGGRIIQQSTVTPKCTKEEIEKKKQEALKRRNLKPKCSKESLDSDKDSCVCVFIQVGSKFKKIFEFYSSLKRVTIYYWIAFCL